MKGGIVGGVPGGVVGGIVDAEMGQQGTALSVKRSCPGTCNARGEFFHGSYGRQKSRKRRSRMPRPLSPSNCAATSAKPLSGSRICSPARTDP